MNEGAQNQAPWWGDVCIPSGETRFWRIGPLHLWISRSAREWRVAHRLEKDPFDDTLIVNEPREEPQPRWRRVLAPGPDEMRFTRFGTRETTEELRVTPVQGDRPLVVNLRVPFVLLVLAGAVFWAVEPWRAAARPPHSARSGKGLICPDSAPMRSFCRPLQPG